MEAVRTLIAWAGDDPDREGLIDTPGRVIKAYSEWFRGYDMDAETELSRTFEDVSGYDDMVILREIGTGTAWWEASQATPYLLSFAGDFIQECQQFVCGRESTRRFLVTRFANQSLCSAVNSVGLCCGQSDSQLE